MRSFSYFLKNSKSLWYFDLERLFHQIAFLSVLSQTSSRGKGKIPWSMVWVLEFVCHLYVQLYMYKSKNSIFEFPLIPQTLNISNRRTTRAKSMNLDIIINLIRHSLKNVIFTLIVFEILLFKRRSVSWPTERVIRGERSERVKSSFS